MGRAFLLEQAQIFCEQLVRPMAHFQTTKLTAGSQTPGDNSFPVSQPSQYRLLFERNPIPMWVFDRDTLRFLAVNKAAIRQYGFTRREFLAMTIADIRPAETIPELLGDVAKRTQGLQKPGVWIHRRKNGDLVDVEIVCHDLTFRGIDAMLVAASDITERQRAQQAALEAEEKYRSIFENAVVGIFQCTPEGRPLNVNDAMAQMHGYDSPQQLLAEVSDVAAQLFVDPPRMMALHAAAHDGIVRNAEVEVYRKDRTRRWMKVSLCNVYDASGNVTSLEGTVEDITERKQAEEALLLRSALLEAQSETTIDGILAVDNADRIVLINRQFALQFSVPDDLLHAGDDLAMRKFIADQVEDPAAFIQRVNELFHHPDEKSRDEIPLRNGRTFDRYSAPLIDATGQHRGRIWYFRDITDRKAAEARIRFLAYYDALTGLPNRVLLRDRLDRALADAHRRNEKAALLFLDLDRFKLINDSLGRSIGDKVLQEVAGRLRECVRERDTIARLDSDKFVIVVGQVHEANDAAVTAERVLARLSETCFLREHALALTASLGISLFPDNSADGETLIRYADQAMQSAKKKGCNTYCSFTSELDTEAAYRLMLENDLRLAIDRNELFLVYQPQLDIATGKPTGFEALLRWRHPRLGLVPPDVFIPIAENSGQILRIGEWVLRSACAQLRTWTEQGLVALPVAVNVSTIQFRHQEFCSLVRRTLLDTGVASSLLELEVTESLLLSSADVVFPVLYELAAMGVKLAIDDFGTGYSSLSYLRQFRAGKLKIDRSFVRDVPLDHDDAAIVAAIIGLARTLKMRVIAEGVETEAQMSFLREHGCDEIQGYYYSKPVPSADAAAMLLSPAATEEIRIPPIAAASATAASPSS
ncbi:MAG TPA: EAL domain-containing protein [Acidobacteriaceae bacterium]|jgi:diguanylate cyclase (GGDEF)-like protein/PAS domain S-box-containing protein|nr:EAL domain-containing protein [Acidobacteriaceae bacterium]